MKRRLAWGLACTLLCAAAVSVPARAEVQTTPLFVAGAVTSGGVNVGTVRVTLNYENGRFRWNGKTWAYRYMFDVDFLAGDNAWLTTFQPHGCGQPYALDPFAGGTDWSVTPWINFNSRLPSYSITPRHMGLEGFTGTTYSGYSNAPPQPGRITLGGEVLRGTEWHPWLAEVNGITFGCEAGQAPGDPVLGLGIGASANPIGAGETLTATMVLTNTGTYVGDDVLLTHDAVPGADYKPGSTKVNGAKVDDKDGDTPLRTGLPVDVPAGETTTVSYEMVVKPGASGPIDLVAHAALAGYDTLNASTQVQTVAPVLGLGMAADKNPVSAGDTLTTTMTLSNTGEWAAKGVLVTQGPSENTTYVPNSTYVNGQKMDDVNGASPLEQGVRVDVPAGGSVKIACSMVVNPGSGGMMIECGGNAALAGYPPLSAGTQVQAVEAAPGLKISPSAGRIGTGETLTTTVTLTNSGTGELKGVKVWHDAVPNATYVPGSTALNKAKVDDVAGDTALRQGMTVDVPAGGTVIFSYEMVVKPGTGGQPINLVAHASAPGFETLNASTSVETFETPPTAVQLFNKLEAQIELAHAVGAFRFQVSGYPMFKRHYDTARAAYEKGDIKTATYNLGRIAIMAAWRGGYFSPDLFKPGTHGYASAMESTAKALIAAL
jgi:uncharacterized repeat protein (TIGR01451 family)